MTARNWSQASNEVHRGDYRQAAATKAIYDKAKQFCHEVKQSLAKTDVDSISKDGSWHDKCRVDSDCTG